VATATAHHYTTVNPYGEEFANRKLICAVAPDAPVGGFAG
jgi:hypothetical protein